MQNTFYSRNRIPILLLFISLCVFGLISLFSLDFNLIPDIEYPELTVITVYPNASPEEVKNVVSVPIEQAALSLKGVKTMSSLSRDGMSVVKIQYRWGVNLTTTHIELREKMDLLGSYFPREVRRPIIIHYGSSSDAIIGITALSDAMDECSLYLLCRKDVLGEMEKIEGITHVGIQGGERPEVKVLVDPEKLVKYNLGVAEVKNALSLANKNFPVGFFNDSSYEYSVRINGEVQDYRELGNIVLKEEDKKLVYVKDVADVVYGTEEKESSVLIDGRSALVLSVYKQPSSNILTVSRKVDERIRRLNERYAGRIVFQKVFDESASVKESLRDLIIAMILGIVFTIVSVYIFLFDVKVSFIIILTVPLSIIGTFIVMKFAGISINLLTLGGFSLAIGMIVDNAVIVVTSVFELLCEGKRDKRYYTNLRRVIPAVNSATFTTIVVFFPVLFLSGILKLVFIQLSLIVVTSLLFSLIIAVTLVPVILETVKIGTQSGRPFKRITALLECSYRRVLSAVFKRKTLSIALLGALTVFGAASYSFIEKRFIESVPQSHFTVKMFVKRQVPFAYTSRLADLVSGIIKSDRRVSKIIAAVGVDRGDVTQNLDGMFGENTATLKVYSNEKGDSIYDLIDSLRKKLRIFSEVDFLITIPDNPIGRLVSRSEFDAVVKVYDPSPGALAERVKGIDAFLKERGLAADVLTSYYMANTEESFRLKRDEVSLYRLDAPLLGEFITSAVSGLRVGNWKNGEFDIPILLRFEKGSHTGVGDLMGLSVKNREGEEIRLREVLTASRSSSPNFILRENQKTYAKVEFNLMREGKGRSPFRLPAGEKASLEAHLGAMGIDYEYRDQFSALRENYGELLLALFLAIFLEYIILASQFRSFSKPVLAIAMIPVSVPGVLLILYLLKSSLNINTFMSIIVLVGLLVNNAIMLFLEYVDRKVQDFDGVLSASSARLVPILITTLSTILALIPSLFTHNRIQVTLSATIILGLSYSTFVTLLYLPLFYHLVYMKRGGKGP